MSGCFPLFHSFLPVTSIKAHFFWVKYVLKSIVRGEGGWRYNPQENGHLVKEAQVCEQNDGRSRLEKIIAFPITTVMTDKRELHRKTGYIHN